MSVLVGAESTVSQESFDGRAKLLAQMNEREQKMAEAAKEEERRSPFRNFYQINEENNRYLMELADTQPKALKILFFIFEHMDNYNALMCSHKVFQEQFGYSSATVKRCVKYLREHGYIHIYKSGTSNVYVANNNLVWKSYGKNAKYCKFPANIVLTMSEQEQQAAACFESPRRKAMHMMEQVCGAN